MSASGSTAEGSATAAEDSGGPPASSYSRGARVLSVGIATTGLFTFAYFSVASYVLDDRQLAGINLLWTVLFIAMTVFYRPVEQYLTRTIAASGGHPYRTAATMQLAFGAVFFAGLFAFRGRLEDVLGSSSLFWVLVVAAGAYAMSYFARGVFAGNRLFGFYGGLVFFEAIARFAFPVAVAVGVASGQTAVAIGIAAAPVASLAVLPFALRRFTATAPAPDGQAGATGFALSVAFVQLGEQTLLNAAALLVPHGPTVAIVFNAFLITRVPLQLFQSVQTSMLPHLAGLAEGDPAFARAIRTTLLAVAAFGAAVVVGLLVLGPPVMSVLIDVNEDWARLGLATIGLGMAFHLAAGTLTQAAYATDRAPRAALAWMGSAALFVAWMALGLVDDPLTRAQVGYAASAALLCAGLIALGAAPRGRGPGSAPRSPGRAGASPRGRRTPELAPDPLE